MRTFINQVLLLSCLSFVVSPSLIHAQEKSGIEDATKEDKKESTKTKKNKRANVDLAILLDTSNSMDGLISQARTQLWNIVRQVADAEKKNQKPVLRVAVFEYGNNNLPASENYLRQVVPLTDDLDEVSAGLFALKTDGGDEYCGAVIQEALRRLDWSTKKNGYKAIYIAGNEPFTQGKVDYTESCNAAIQSGVVVNTIHCGNYERGVAGMWKHGADLAEGQFMNINQDQKIAQIKTPHDAILIQLNVELNSTYLWYGASTKRKALEQNQILQDENSASAGSNLSRIATKAGSAYSNRGRDLVDSTREDASLLSKIDVKLLPENMQKMNAEQRKVHVETMATKRSEIQKKIAEATKKRDDFIAKQRESQSKEAAKTFGDAISEAVESQLKKYGFEVRE